MSKPKIPVWENFGGPWNGKVCIVSVHLEYRTTAMWYLYGPSVILWQFGMFSPIWYIVPIKTGNPAPLLFHNSFRREKIAALS
jgi:hypothetical protein